MFLIISSNTSYYGEFCLLKYNVDKLLDANGSNELSARERQLARILVDPKDVYHFFFLLVCGIVLGFEHSQISNANKTT